MLAAEVHRSTGWIWLVVGGFAVGMLLLWHVVSNAVATLPDEIRDRLRTSVRSNARPLIVSAVVLVWTLAYGLYSVNVVPVADEDGQRVAAGSVAGDDASGAEVAGEGGVGEVAADATVAGAPAGSATARTGGGARRAGGTAVAGPGGPSALGVSLGAPTGLTIRDANLYSGAANTQGITANQITICGHAPLVYGQLLNTKPEDLLVFWNWLNDNGGIFGRKFNVALEDDRYTAEGGVPAAQRCAERKPFMIFGALGSDVIPPVREWAETQKQLYLYGFTVKAGSEKLRYSYSATISQEELSAMLGDVTVTRFKGKKAGIVWRNSSNFQPGREAFKKAVTAKGGEVVADIPIQDGQATFTQEIVTLQQRGAEVVFVLEAADAQLNFIKQAKTQRYSPQWLVFSFNLQTQGLMEDALNPPLMGTNLAPAYECRKYDGPYASYAEEIKVFEAAYAKYSPNTDLCGIAGDVAWQGWVGFKAMAALFETCGPNCTRNRLGGVMESGYKATIGAACEVDFTNSPHHGGHASDLMEAYRVSGSRVGWRNAQRCLRAP